MTLRAMSRTFLQVFIVGLALFVAAFVSAWTGPPGSPPTCPTGTTGCDAPVNVSTTNQAKKGGFEVNTAGTYTSANGTALTAPKFCIGTSCITSWASAGGLGGSGTTNYLPKFTGASTIGNSVIYDDGTNIGISTVPGGGAKLQVLGSGSAYGIYSAGATYSFYGINSSNIATYLGNGTWGVHTNGNIWASGHIYSGSGQIIGYGGPAYYYSFGAGGMGVCNVGGSMYAIQGWTSGQALYGNVWCH